MEHGAVRCPLGRKLLTLELSSILERCSLRKKSPKKPTATVFRCLSYTLRHLLIAESLLYTQLIRDSLETSTESVDRKVCTAFKEILKGQQISRTHPMSTT